MSDWLQEQALRSAERLRSTNPQLLSPVGREIRQKAITMLVREAADRTEIE